MSISDISFALADSSLSFLEFSISIEVIFEDGTKKKISESGPTNVEISLIIILVIENEDILKSANKDLLPISYIMNTLSSDVEIFWSL